MNLSHLPNISVLQLDVLIFFKDLLFILNSLPNPAKLTHLTARIFDDFNQANQDNPNFPESLTYSLHSLHLTVKSFSLISSLLKSFRNPENLHKLALQIPLQNSDQLEDLALLIGNFWNLSHLAIKNEGLLQCSRIESHREFFHQISKMVRLKSLEINLQEKVEGITSGSQHEYLKEYANCVETLQELQEISFTQPRYDRQVDFLATVLIKKGSRIKRLNLKFFNQKNEIDHLKKFSKAFEEMHNLEALSLGGLFIKERSLEKFSKTIQQLKWLRSLRLNIEQTNLDLAAFVRIITKILMKKGLEEFKWIGLPKIKKGGDEEVAAIDIQKVVLRNPQLRKLGHSALIFPNQMYVFRNTEVLPVYHQYYS